MKFSLISLIFIFLSIVIFLSEWLQKSGIIYFPSGIRHILILVFFFVSYIAFGRRILFPFRFKFLLLILFFFLLINYFVTTAPLVNYVLGIGFTFLFLIIFIFASNTEISQRGIISIFNYLLIFILVMSVFPIAQAILARSTLRWLPGLFREVGAFGSAMNTATIISLSLFIVTSKKKYLYIAIFFSVGVLMTILKKTMISNLFVWFFFFNYCLVSVSRFKILIYCSLFFLFGFLSYGGDLFSNFEENQGYLDNVGAEGHVRLGMYLASFKISNDYFPLGSGTGTFGSLASIINGYSSLYYDYGISNIGSNSAEDVANGHHTLLDTFWPHILAELGIIGTVIFLYFWFYPIVKSFKLLKQTSNLFDKASSFFILLMILTMTWEGFSLYTPEVPIFVMLNSGLGGLCYYHLKGIKNEYK